MTTETLFDIIQTPIIGVIAGAIIFRQQRKTKPDTALKTAILSGVCASVLYAILKFLF